MTTDTEYQRLIVKLAELFCGKRTKTREVTQALALICEQFSFDSGLVYEIDQDNLLNLKEQFSLSECAVCQQFSVEEIQPKLCSRMANETVSYVAESQESLPEAQNLRTLFDAQSLVLFSVVDETARIYGLLVFQRKEEGSLIAPKELDMLAVILSMLGRFTGFRMFQNKVSFAQTSLESVLDNTGIDIYVNDFYNHDILYVNKSMAAPYGGISRFRNEKCWKVLFPGQTGPCEFCPQKNLIDEDGNPTKVYSWDYQRPFDGSWFRVFSAAFRWVDGRLAHVVSSADITDNKRNEALIEYMANYDALTKLPNRRMLIHDLENTIANSGKDDHWYLLFFDIDGFKAINDRLGHDAGDEFLVLLGEFFSVNPMLKQRVYRNGGDEFVALLGNNVSMSHVQNLAGFIHRRFQEPWILKKGTVFCNTSIGVSCYPKDGDTPEGLIQKADQAMYQVKKAGGGEIRFAE